MSYNFYKYYTLYLLVSLSLFILGLYISFTWLYNGYETPSFIMFMLTSINLIIALYLPFIITITNLIKR